jgi:hypothetical protein
MLLGKGVEAAQPHYLRRYCLQWGTVALGTASRWIHNPRIGTASQSWSLLIRELRSLTNSHSYRSTLERNLFKSGIVKEKNQSRFLLDLPLCRLEIEKGRNAVLPFSVG